MNILRKKVLVLNKSWQAVGLCTVKRAMSLLTKLESDGMPKAMVVDEQFGLHDWDSWELVEPGDGPFIRTPSKSYRVPLVIRARTDNIPRLQVAFSRRSVFRRDEFRCQYCGVKPHTSELSVDHVTPRSRGGANSFLNCVSSCKSCNTKKGNRTPEEAGMDLIRKPFRPSFVLTDEPYPAFWFHFLK